MKPAPFAHQIVDTQSLIDKPAYALWCDPGTGKSRTVIDAACELYRQGRIDSVIVVCPAPARSVWVDPNPVLGEWSKWCADDVPYTLGEYHQKTNLTAVGRGRELAVLVTNPEFIRRTERRRPLQAWAHQRETLLVVDESWAYKTPNAAQTKAMCWLRDSCSRVVLLNGTPGEPKDQYTQFRILNPKILDNVNHMAFRAHYCVMGGYLGKQVIGYQNMDEFHARTAPYCVVRKIRDCVDIGPEPIRTQIEARLMPATWKLYTELRDEAIAWLSAHESATAMQAGVKTMRLAQITNGFLGGVIDHGPDLLEEPTGVAPPSSPLREVGREKLDTTIAYLKEHWHDSKLLVFAKFRPDVERTALALKAAFLNHEVVRVYGQQDPKERERAKTLLAPGGDPTPGIAVANAFAGGASLNFAASQLTVFLGHEYSHRVRRQAEGRTDRPGQTGRVTFLDVLAVGPQGQRTVDHQIVAAQRRGEELETWGAQEWLKALKAA